MFTFLKLKSALIYLTLFLFLLNSLSQAQELSQSESLAVAARSQVGTTLYYDSKYYSLTYPNGDLPKDRGVCTDVVIRAFRNLGLDLQVLVHEDMQKNMKVYPKIWGLTHTDSNIDHRRVPNLMVFFKRQGKEIKVTSSALDYKAGDIVTWRLSNGLPHIGVVSAVSNPVTHRPLVIHNIGMGAQEEDVLFQYEITGHFRYFAA